MRDQVKLADTRSGRRGAPRFALPAWWRERTPRERAVLGAGLAGIVVLAGYAFVWQPAADGIRRVESDLPGLRAQTANVLAMADEAKRLRAAGGQSIALTPERRVAAVRRSLERAGLLRETAAAGAGTAAPVTSLSVGADAVPRLAVVASGKSEPPDIATENGGRVKIRIADVEYGIWVAWLATAEGELGARAAHVVVTALAPPAPAGHVRAEVVLEWAANAAGAPASASTPGAKP